VRRGWRARGFGLMRFPFDPVHGTSISSAASRKRPRV
jgi:hypothetical protein